MSGPDTVRQLLEAVVVVVVLTVVVVDAVVAVVEVDEVVVEVVEEVVEHEFVVQTWYRAGRERELMIVTS